MKAIDFDADVAKKIRKIRTKDKKLFIKIQKQLRLFQNDPHHNSLKLHKLGRSLKNIWSISIDRSIRTVSYTHLTLPTNREV